MVSVQGTVESQKAGGTQWQPVKLNDTLCPGDTIRVLNNSRAQLALANQSVLRINENTTITLEGVDEDRTTLVDLLKGAALFFSRGTRKLKVKTQYAIFGVRGTEFFIRTEERQAFMSVFEGTVLAESQAGSLTLTSDQSTVVEAGKAPVLTVVARPRDAVQWALYYPPIIYLCLRANTRSQEQTMPAFLPIGLRSCSPSVAWMRPMPISTQLCSLNPNFSDALALQSIIAVVQNDKEKALNQAQKAVVADPQSATAQIALSYARQARFDLEGARTSVEAAVKLDPGNAIAWARLADLQASFGELGKALEAAKKAESLAPDLALTQTVLGFAFLTKVNIDESMAAFEKAITLDQAAPLPRLGLGLAKIRKGDLEEGGREIEIAAGLGLQQFPCPQLPGQDLLRGKTHGTGRARIRHRQKARPQRSDALVLRCDPIANRESAGRGPAQLSESHRIERQPGDLPLQIAARFGSGRTPVEPGTNLQQPGFPTAGVGGRLAIGQHRPDQFFRPPFFVRLICGVATP